MTSWQTKAVSAVVRVSGVKKMMSSTDRVRARVEAVSLRPSSFAPPKHLDRAVTLSVGHRNHWPVYEIAPKGPAAGRRILYLHGGAYIEEILIHHWRLAAQLARQVPARVCVPVYPLAPHGRATTVVPAATDILADVIEESGPDNVIVMGDSAGGGMALAVAQQLRDRYGVQPARIVLISPWLDVTMTHPDQARIERLDPMLARAGLAEAGRLYADPLDPADPQVSPLHGTLDGLAPLTVFSGTHDILLTDSDSLAAKATKAGVPIDYHRADCLPHVYPLMPVPEGRTARDLIVKACQQ
ncbi:alpha/beta hydrolase [Streptomyces sp. NBC_00536]|uniref:alpha/beta hydrolase n=1 Tax=Streptomyces sp. NBC_00536 TaxID=2975769 RepID=UPI002E80F031|nr:alpha/beta hydrolase [Streptomyces sp. NBC_00536]WUC83335.1 alpha/beta hydrolase [Streptomyces sp. NBC_00536]